MTLGRPLPAGLWGSVGALARAPTLIGHLCRFRPQVIQTQLMTAEILGGLSRWILPDRPLWLHVEQNVYPWKSGPVRALERFLAGGDGLWVTPSRVVADHVQNRLGLPPGRVRVIPNGVKLTGREAPAVLENPCDSKSPFRIGTVERLVPQKRQELILRALRRLRDRGLNVEWSLLGEGSCGRAIEKSISRLGLTPYCHWFGETTDPEVLFSQLHAYVTASDREGFGISTIEAAVRAIPVLAPDIPIFRETLGGLGGLLYAPGSAEDLADRVGRLVIDPTYREHMARSLSTATRGKYGLERMIDAYATLIQSNGPAEMLTS